MRAAYSSSARAMAGSQQVKGNLIDNTRRFVLKHRGENAWQEILRGMPQEHRETIASGVTIGWYDCFTYDLLNERVAQVLGAGRPDEVLQALGRFTAEQDFAGVYRLFLRLATPTTVFEQLPRIWPRYQQGGEWVVERLGEAEWLGTQKNCDVSSEATCIRVQGFVQRVGEMTSQRGLRVERPMCRLRGDPHCQLLARWLA